MAAAVVVLDERGVMFQAAQGAVARHLEALVKVPASHHHYHVSGAVRDAVGLALKEELSAMG